MSRRRLSDAALAAQYQSIGLDAGDARELAFLAREDAADAAIPPLGFGDDDVDLSGCPYYRGVGICAYGCYSEPSCITDEPRHGWPSQRRSRHGRAKHARDTARYYERVARVLDR